MPEWLAPWIPAELASAFSSMLSAFKPVIETMLQWAPSLAGGLSITVWVLWALGSGLLILLGLGLSALIAMLRRSAFASVDRTATAHKPA